MLQEDVGDAQAVASKNSQTPPAWNLSVLGIYAIAMALLESAVVVYMRRLYYPDNPLELFPLSFLNSYDPRLELAREAATILMILAVALLAVRPICKVTWTRCFAAFVYVFGVWDVFYYVWLKVLMDWPRNWWEWDVLFLIPSVWLGPWICPALIAILFVIWGAWGLSTPRQVHFTVRSLGLFVLGVVLGLVTFLQPAYQVDAAGADLSQFMPSGYWWWLFVPSYLLMMSGLGLTASAPFMTEPTSPAAHTKPDA